MRSMQSTMQKFQIIRGEKRASESFIKNSAHEIHRHRRCLDSRIVRFEIFDFSKQRENSRSLNF